MISSLSRINCELMQRHFKTSSPFYQVLYLQVLCLIAQQPELNQMEAHNRLTTEFFLSTTNPNLSLQLLHQDALLSFPLPNLKLLNPLLHLQTSFKTSFPHFSLSLKNLLINKIHQTPGVHLFRQFFLYQLKSCKAKRAI